MTDELPERWPSDHETRAKEVFEAELWFRERELRLSQYLVHQDRLE